MTVISVQDLYKTFVSHEGRPIKALDGVSLEVAEGEILGILGPNGAGKTTFLMIAQFVPITYFLEYFRASFGFKPSLNYLLLNGFGLIIVYFILGLSIMRFAFHQARKKGIIVKLSE